MVVFIVGERRGAEASAVGFIFIVTVIIKYKVLGNTNGWTREKGWCDCGATMNISTALSASIS